MTKINIEEWFSSPNRWEKEHECLNMENINEKPCIYEGSLEDWIKELTTFIFLYPKEWNRILSEYKAIHSKQKQKKCDRLDFYRDDEGYLRKVGEKDNLLRFHFQSDCFTYKNQIAYIMEETKILSFDEYLKYCRLNGKERTLYLKRLKDKLTKESFQTQEAFQISFETDYESSDFNNRDIYVDMLNHTYVFL